MLNRIKDWAQAEPLVRVAAIIGSRARVDLPADNWADLDIALLVADLTAFLNTTHWLAEIDSHWGSHIDHTEMSQGLQVRVIFEHGNLVDFILYDLKNLEEIFSDQSRQEEISSRMQQGLEVLVDKDGITESIIGQTADQQEVRPPSAEAFASLIAKFAYHSVWTINHLRRGELWRAHVESNAHLNDLLLQMIEWHAQAVYGDARNTWTRGRFLEQWAHPQVLESLGEVFARHDAHDIARALDARTNLFFELAQTVSKWVDCNHILTEHQHIFQWIRQQLTKIQTEP